MICRKCNTQDNKTIDMSRKSYGTHVDDLICPRCGFRIQVLAQTEGSTIGEIKAIHVRKT